jgi:hypothetical protein
MKYIILYASTVLVHSDAHLAVFPDGTILGLRHEIVEADSISDALDQAKPHIHEIVLINTLDGEGINDMRLFGDCAEMVSFSHALEQVKRGRRAARFGWNGKGMWIALSGTQIRPAKVPTDQLWSPHSRAEAERQGGEVEVCPSLIMRTADGKIVMGWLASQTDLLAEDWVVFPD